MTNYQALCAQFADAVDRDPTMSTEHPIAPPSGLLREWQSKAPSWRIGGATSQKWIAEWAAQWGWGQRNATIETELQAARDQELEACEALILQMRPHGGRAWTDEQAAVNDALIAVAVNLRNARSPKPPSLAEQATTKLDEAVMRGDCITTTDAMPSLRAALERLATLETQPDE